MVKSSVLNLSLKTYLERGSFWDRDFADTLDIMPHLSLSYCIIKKMVLEMKFKKNYSSSSSKSS